MCFSAEASFTAGALLSVFGYACLREVKEKRQIFLALVPLFFAIQQFAEGILWLSLNNGTYPTPLGQAAVYFYLFIAFVTWPIWLPFSIWCMEKDPLRKKLILLSLLFGLVFVVGNFYLLKGHEINITVIEHSIQYSAYTFPSLLIFVAMRLFYVISILVPTFVSSVPRLKLFGIGVAISYLFADFIYVYAFTSVWCFFSALASALIFIVLRDRTLYPTK